MPVFTNEGIHLHHSALAAVAYAQGCGFHVKQGARTTAQRDDMPSFKFTLVHYNHGKYFWKRGPAAEG
jgi:hypothetical protein